MDYSSRLPKYTASMTISFKNQSTINYVFNDDIPEDVMTIYKSLMGDGKARVNISADMGIKRFGTGPSISCSLSISCNQDEETIDKAFQLLGEATQAHAKELFGLAENDFNELLRQRNLNPDGTFINPNQRMG